MPRNRLPNWPARLNAFFAEALVKPYRLGTWDCAIFCAAGVEAITGVLPVDLRGRYETPLGMRREMIAVFGDSLRAGVSGVLRAEPAPIRAARRGDVLLRVDETGLEHLALCGGPDGLAPADVGLVRRPLSDFSSCWRVG